MVKKFKEPKEISMDYELELTKQQKNFNSWFYLKVKPWLKGDILETGSGKGTFSQKIIRDFKGEIYITEINPQFIIYLKKQFKKKNVKVIKLDLNNKKDFKKIKKRFDSVLSLNVLEHVRDDVLALKLLNSILKPKGKIVMYVPCHKFLYCDFDVAEGHYRRYSKKELEKKAKSAGFKMKYSLWFNIFGIPSRFLVGNFLKVKKTPESSFSLYNKMVPVFRFFEEKVFRNIAGVGIIAVLEKI